MLQLPAPGRDRLNAANVGQNGLSGKIKPGKSLVAHDARADGLLANPALGLEEDDIQPRLSQ